MSKKEKYYRFIVNDLVNKTEVNVAEDYINLPFKEYGVSIYGYNTKIYLSELKSSFANHVVEYYGASVGEVNILWDLYDIFILNIILGE